MATYPTEPIPLKINDFAWMSGMWTGKIKGQYIEEHWSKPAGGAMMAMFRWLNGETVKFYELMTLETEDETVIFRIKHFHPGLKGWEEKDQAVELKPVQLTDNKVVFLMTNPPKMMWLIYELVADDTLTACFAKPDVEPKPEDKFIYHRS